MTRRPERLKATKLYGSENAADKQKLFGENDNVTVQNPITTNITQSNSKSTKADASKEVPNDFKTHIPSTSVVHEAEIRNSKIQSLGMEKQNLKSNWMNGLPKGFVSRSEMEQKVYRKNDVNGVKQVIPQRNGLGVLSDVTAKNNAPPKENTQCNVPSGFVTLKDMETRIKNRKTKSTKLTTLYQEELAIGIPYVPSVHAERDPPIKTKSNPNAKHVFSKLEKRKDEPTPTDEGKEANTKLQKQNNAGVNKIPEMALVSKSYYPSIAKRSEDEKASNSLTETDQDKEDPLFSAVDQGRRDSGAKQPSITVTPRMTSTAILKVPRKNTKENNINDTFQSIRILIVNANGKGNKGCTPTERRKNAIQNVIVNHLPKIVLFQEFAWKGINGKTWAKCPIPEQYVYKGHYDASIMYDANCITVKDLPASDIQTILSGLQSNANNRLKRTFPMDFNPVARMCLSRVSAPTKPALDFICISWHGKSNENGGGRMKELKKIEYFEYWMEFLRHIREKFRLPIVAAGDYNVDMFSIEKYVTSPFKLCIYEASMRRTVRGIVDYCIVTDDLDFTDISWVNLEHDTSVFNPNEILDHDPIVGSLAVSLLGTSDVTLGKKRSWPSPIVKPTW